MSGNTKVLESRKSKVSEFLKQDIRIRRNSLSDKKKEKFYAQFSLLVSSGLDIKTVLELLESEESKEPERKLIVQLKEDLMKGSSLSQTMDRLKCFSRFEVFSIRIGEDSGKLQQVLNDLASYYSRKLKQRRQIVQALTYPIIVIATVFGVLVFMLKVMVPMFTEMFRRFDGELPFLTRMVIAFSDWFGSVLPFMIFFIAGLSVFVFSYRKVNRFREVSSGLILKLPIIGILVKKIYLGRFCHSMHLLLSARLPLTFALDHVSEMISYFPIETAIKQIGTDITKGETFRTSLSRHEIFEKRLLSLVHVGEETNRLDDIFKKLNEQYQSEVEHLTSVLVSLMEPVFILVLGLIVGLVLVSIYLPIFQMSTGVAG